MTVFLDGPATGETLMLKRAPVFLRVTCTRAKKWDALDQLDDEPAANETLYAYRVEGEVGVTHLYFGGGRGGFYTRADYKFVLEQPDDATMRDTRAWRAWCQHQVRPPSNA